MGLVSKLKNILFEEEEIEIPVIEKKENKPVNTVNTEAKKEEIKKRGLSTKIEIDGGVNDEVLSYLKDIDIVVSASYILKDLRNIEKIKSL